ncbi:hypothetical protein CKAH01_13790 [Colletotrichum kahawae]|uniref:Uncharacterized protein n=1 Tax=Colletotrichum kahawae TaxID=34407 RepID=A0AAD9YP32_COLKA|nr:hypothetical protein CKAH01_13790 [Colletotrichum kahawae]
MQAPKRTLTDQGRDLPRNAAYHLVKPMEDVVRLLVEFEKEMAPKIDFLQLQEPSSAQVDLSELDHNTTNLNKTMNTSESIDLTNIIVKRPHAQSDAATSIKQTT